MVFSPARSGPYRRNRFNSTGNGDLERQPLDLGERNDR